MEYVGEFPDVLAALGEVGLVFLIMIIIGWLCGAVVYFVNKWRYKDY